MSEFARRAEYEKRLRQRLVELGRVWHVRMFKRGRSHREAEFWQQMIDAYAGALTPELDAIYLAMAEQEMNGSALGVEWGGMVQDAARWSAQYGLAEARRIVERTRRVIEETVRNPRLRSDNRALIGSQGALDDEDAWAALFGETRADLIAVTETTSAAQAGSSGWAGKAMLDNPGLVLTAVWQTMRDERVCPICGPLNGKPRGVAWIIGPPAHPRCRCWTLWVPN